MPKATRPLSSSMGSSQGLGLLVRVRLTQGTSGVGRRAAGAERPQRGPAALDAGGLPASVPSPIQGSPRGSP